MAAIKGSGKTIWEGGSGVVVIDPEVTSEEQVLHNRVFEGHYSAKLAD